MPQLVRALASRSRLIAVLTYALLLPGLPTNEKRVSIYSNAANYSVVTTDRDGRDYIGLLEVLDPLGQVSAHSDGKRWLLRYNQTSSEFEDGATHVRINAHDFDMASPFFLQNGRGFVPLTSLGSLLQRILGGPVSFHEAARRIFIGSVAVRFTTQLNKSDPPTLAMNFTNPVNPTISTEPGKLRMVFTRDALISPGAQSIALDSKIITTATYEESDGAAAVTVNATAPLFASFSNGGRTITISAAKQVSTAQTETSSAKPQPSAPPETAPPPAPSAAPQPTAPYRPVRYFAVIDGSHGGTERGAALTEQLVEKDVTLAFARQLRQDLESRGLATLLLRDGDNTLTLDQRAGLTNRTHPAVYVCLHASSVGSGVRIYTALLPVGDGDNGAFLDWETAQSSYLPLSRTVADTASAALRKKGVSARILPGSLRPLNNIAAPAIAIEIAPPTDGIGGLNSTAYKDLVSNAIGSALQSVRAQLEAPQ